MPSAIFTGIVALPCFRAMAVAWAVAKFPTEVALRNPAIAAANGAAGVTARALRAARDEPEIVASIPPDPGILKLTAERAANAVMCAAATAAFDAVAVLATDAAANAAAAIGGKSARTASIAAMGKDAVFTQGGDAPVARAIRLASSPLWPGRVPSTIDGTWRLLKRLLLLADEDWEVWVRWYEDCLAGRPSLGEAFDIAVATLPDELWEQGAAAVNARIKELIAEHTVIEPIPAQGAGPHFALSPELKIALAPPGEIDALGNNMARIGNLLPVVRQAAGDLAGHLNPNTQPEISRILGDYRAAIAGEPERIAWGTVFGLGVRLENAATAAHREIDDRLRDPLEDAAQEALDSLLTLHGPLILATAEGRELSDEADRFRLSRDERDTLQKDAERLSEHLRNAPNIVEPAVIEVTGQAAEAIGDGPHPERGAAYWLATAKNVATILVPAGGLGALAHSMGGVGEDAVLLTGALLFHENERLREAARVIGADYYRVLDAALDTAKDQADLAKAQAVARLRLLTPFRDFVIANEEPLRRVAGYSTNLRWMLWYIDFIVRTSGEAVSAVPQVLTSVKIVVGKPS